MAALTTSPGPVPGSVVLAPAGDLDVTSSQEFDFWLTRARLGYHQVVLDLSAVTFLDTSALAVIVRNWKKLTAAGGALILAGPRYENTKTLWITGLAERLPLYETVAAATAALPASPGGEQPMRG
jgi:anti-sigma B factor antagonist